MTRVTIGIPAYKNMRTIERAIKSIASQTFTEFKVILSDDQSGDGTFELCCELVAHDNRFRVMQQPKRQGFMHFRRLIELADTPYFVWLAGDDYWGPEFLEKTVAALDQDETAVSAIPQVVFEDTPKGMAPPDTSTLSGTWSNRVATFLSRPNGCRMYGLFRTKVLLNSFPGRTMNAYDWYLTLGFLRCGTQVEIPNKLLFRERTDWRDYSRMVDDIYDDSVFRRYPLLDMTIAALKNGLIPIRPAITRMLFQMNIEKRDERLIVVEPEAFFLRIAEQSCNDLSANSTHIAINEAARLMADQETAKDVATAAKAALLALAETGNPSAQRYAGRHLAQTGEFDRAEDLFARAAKTGDPEARVRLSLLKFERGKLESDRLTSILAKEARSGNDFAVSQLAAKFCEGQLAGISPQTQYEIFSRCSVDAGEAVIRARAKLISDGLAVPRDREKAIELLTGIAAENPWARKDRGLLYLELGRVEQAISDLTAAVESGADWAVSNLLDIQKARVRPKTQRLVSDLLRHTEDKSLADAIREKQTKRAAPTAELADDRGLVSPASATSKAKIIAIVAARNAEATLDRVLSHYAAEHIPVLVVDHGSTDRTSKIAMAHHGTSAIGYFYEPYLGYFDLSRQLTLKRDFIANIDCDWVLHADADEFIETADGTPLVETIGQYTDTEAVAFDCTEYAFLPRSETEAHGPENFPETMRHYVVLSERDRKQRVFRKDCDFATWLQTGGHTVSRCPNTIAQENLRVRHYLGLSMNHIRSQYLTRVFSGEDRTKSWHGNRLARSAEYIQVPSASDLWDIDVEGFRDQPRVNCPPVFANNRSHNRSDGSMPSDQVDLFIATANPEAADWARRKLNAEFPDLRFHVLASHAHGRADTGTCPTLHVIGLPSDGAMATTEWLCGIAGIRQAAMNGRRRYRELRREDCELQSSLFTETVLELLSSKPQITSSLPRHTPLDVGISNPYLWDLGRDFLKDLGYFVGNPTVSE